MRTRFVFGACVVVALTVGLGGALAGQQPSLVFNPATDGFGTIDFGTTAPSKTFMLTNSGGAATGALKVSISGSGAAQFRITSNTCTAPSLGPKKSCSVAVNYTPSAAGATDSATLTAMSKKPDATRSVTLTGAGTPPATDLGITKSVSDPTPNVNDQITFTVTLTNPGSNTATGVSATDVLPAGLTFASSTASQGVYNNGNGAWTVGTVAAGASATLVITVTVASPLPQTNAATITHADQPDPNPGNNSASATETPQLVDLAIAKSVSDTTPNVDDQITFTVILTNNGPDQATGVSVTDLLPAGLTFASSAPSQGVYDAVTGIWTVGTVADDASETLVITVTVVSSSAQTNTATITADQYDPNTGNNSASASEVPQQADLSITKSVSNAAPIVGDEITFTLTLTNSGPDQATGVSVTDPLPTGLTYVSSNPSQGVYDNASGNWTVGAVAAGDGATLTIVVTVASSGTKTNTANADADQFDPTLVDNTDSATVTPLAASVTPNPDTIASATIGVPVARSYTVTNLSAGFTGRAVGTTFGSARIATPTVADGGEQEFEITVTPGSTSLSVRIGGASDPQADLDLFLYNCTSGACVIETFGAGDAANESLAVANPAAGLWKVTVDGFSVPAGTTTYDYLDVFVNPAFGSVSITDANALRPAGSQWTVPGTVTANAAPAADRVLYGHVDVRTNANALVGQGDVIIQSVTP